MTTVLQQPTARTAQTSVGRLGLEVLAFASSVQDRPISLRSTLL
jgi:hypothetical protein